MEAELQRVRQQLAALRLAVQLSIARRNWHYLIEAMVALERDASA